MSDGSTRSAAPNGEVKEPQVQVRFITKLEERLRVTEAPIELPTRLTRAGLSEVINHLLGNTSPRPFDFLLNNELLRGSLAKGLVRYGISGESVVTLEYIECIPPPQPECMHAHKDWIAALAAHPSGGKLLLSACYDHAAYVWGSSGDQAAALVGHTGPVKGVAWLANDNSSGSLRAATASKDHTVRTWRLTPTSSAGGSAMSATCEAVLAGHDNSVEALVANPSGDQLLSGAWNGTIHLWSLSDVSAAVSAASASNAEVVASKAPSSKRAKSSRRGNDDEAAPTALPPVEIASAQTLSGHTGCVSSLCWPTVGLVYSGSWDGTIREWQLDVGSPSATLAGQAAIIALDISLTSKLIASGHTDHALRVWDARLQQAAMQFSVPHKGWVSAVRWCPEQAHLIATSSYDGRVQLWDIRSTIPVHEITKHEGKALCLTWDGGERLGSGGEDGELRVASVTMPG